MTKNRLVLCVLALGAWTGCGASGGSSESAGKSDGTRSSGGSFGNYGSGGGAGSAGTIILRDAGAVLPTTPEQEQNLAFLAPRAGANYVYVANPSRNTVTAIRSDTLEISDKPTGDSPTYLATVPGQDVALVINAGSHTLSILTENRVSATAIPVIAKANAIAIAPDGQHAVIWFDSAQVASASKPTTPATGSTQEVSVVTLTPAAAGVPVAATVVSMSVGYDPSAVVFSNDNAAAFVVTDDGISELRFASITAPGIAPFTRLDEQGATTFVRSDGGLPADGPTDAVPLPTPDAAGDAGMPPHDGSAPGLDGASSYDGGATQDSEPGIDTTAPDNGEPPMRTAAMTSSTGKAVDVSVTPDGAFAIARREGSSRLLLVDLKQRTVTAVDLSSTITDLDLLPDGTQAFAVLRAESKLVRIDIPAGFTDPTRRTDWPFEGRTVGSVTTSGQGRYALLYTTAADVTVKSLVIFDLARDSYRAVDLHKTIRSVAVAPDEKTALIVHRAATTAGAGGSGGGGADGSKGESPYGYTLVELGSGFTKLQETAAEPYPFAITPNSAYAFVLLRDDKAGVRIAERISLTSFLADDYQLGSPPSSIAALSESARKVFVGQVYSEGRISFIDWVTGSVQTVTGFALNGRIQQ